MSKLTRYSVLLLLVIALAACAAPPKPVDAGLEALKAGDTAKAITNLEKAVADEPGSAQAHILLGQAYYRANNRKDDAQKELTTGFTLDKSAGLVLDSQDPEEFFVVGNIYSTLGTAEQSPARFDQALKAYQKVLELKPDKAAAYTNIGVVYYQTNRLDEAIAQYQKALSLDPKDAETQYLLGAAYTQKQNLAEAEKAFNTALELKPELAPAYVGLGNIYLLKKDFEKAVSTLEKANSLQPNAPETLFALGQAYEGAGRKPEAIQAFNQFLQLNPPEPFRSQAQDHLQKLSAQ
jgi:Flp pilus assembly protein TadD